MSKFIFFTALFLHVLGACIWVGGHLVLLFRYVPEALKKNDPKIISDFEDRYGSLGLPAIFVQIITGIYMGFIYYGLPFMSFGSGLARALNVKILLLFCIFALAIHAKVYVIPKLSQKNLKSMCYHIALINVVSLLMLFIGTFFRFGGI